jgi:hypothetical protein
VLDCNAVLLKTAEGMADLAKSIGLTASRRRLYQQPARSALNDWMKLYGYRATPQLRPVETDTPQAKAG